jgi:hypothetical protein
MISVSTYHKCNLCSGYSATTLVTFKQNVSYLFARREQEFSGRVCFGCMTATFLKFEFVTLVGTWWGIIGCFVGPFFVFTNLLEYIAGSFSIARDAISGRTTPPPAKEIAGNESTERSETLPLLAARGQIREFTEASDLAIGRFASLIETYPSCFIDESWLPLDKIGMKRVLKLAIAQEQDSERIEWLKVGWMLLAEFQPNIGETPLPFPELTNRAEFTSPEFMRSFERWLEISKSAQAERDRIKQEISSFLSLPK